MKKLLILICILFSTTVFAQITVSPDSAKYYEGSLVTVCGEITSGKITENETVHINFGDPYPKNIFSVVHIGHASCNGEFRIFTQFKCAFC